MRASGSDGCGDPRRPCGDPSRHCPPASAEVWTSPDGDGGLRAGADLGLGTQPTGWGCKNSEDPDLPLDPNE